MIDPLRIDAFVAKNADYYSEKWQSAENGATSLLGFNRAAFFAAAFWLIYRKLYIPLLIVIVVMIADVLLSVYLEESGIVSKELIAAWDRFSPFLYSSAVGLFGNYWYWRKFQNVDAEANSQSPDPAIQETYLRRKGGTNALGVWVVVAIVVALITLVIFYG